MHRTYHLLKTVQIVIRLPVAESSTRSCGLSRAKWVHGAHRIPVCKQLLVKSADFVMQRHHNGLQLGPELIEERLSRVLRGQTGVVLNLRHFPDEDGKRQVGKGLSRCPSLDAGFC